MQRRGEERRGEEVRRGEERRGGEERRREERRKGEERREERSMATGIGLLLSIEAQCE